jgi:hypothetical protein
MAKNPIPTPEELRQLLRYEPETGKLFWREAPLSLFTDAGYPAAHRCALWNGKYAGREALAYREKSRPYAYGDIFGTKVYAHRAIVALHEGEWPKVVDHIDGDKTNNRLSNLRSVTTRENAMNGGFRRDNTSGVTGVYLDKRDNRWCAEIFCSGRKIHIGRFRDFESAKAAREAHEAVLGFHPNHGRASVKPA